MEFRKSTDYEKSLDLTEVLMMPYYKEYQLEWKREERKKVLSSVEHYHILLKNEFQGFFAYKVDGENMFVYDVQIMPEAQGSGIGTEVMAYLFNVAANTGVFQIKLSVFKSNSLAFKFYEKLAFKVQEELNMVFRLCKNVT